MLGPIAAQAVEQADFGQGGTGANATSQQQPQGQKKPNFTVSHYQDWDVRCPESDQSQARCEMTQKVTNPDNGKPIMRVVMGYPPQADSAAMIFVTPLGTRLAPGIKMDIDGGQSHQFPFQICLKQGCRADYPIKSSLKNTMKHGSNANVEIIGPRGKKINLKISLQGFTAANRQIRP